MMPVRSLCWLICFAFSASAVGASAQIADPRILETPYDPNTVYTIPISRGLASVVEFGMGEAVESVVVGDAQNWLVETTASANRVVIKPGTGADTTNMVVVTSKRTYTFILDAGGGMDLFLVRFVSPDVPPTREISYKFGGNRPLFPRLMSDNGRVTSIYWPKEARLPAVFVFNEAGEEIAVQSRPAGDGLIIDGVHERYVFRLGRDSATARRHQRHPQ